MGPRMGATLRAENLTRSLRLLHAPPAGVTRAELARVVGCSRSTAAALVEDLCRADVVREALSASGRPGRPSALLIAHPRSPRILAVEVAVGSASVMEAPLGGAPEALTRQSVPSDDLATVLDAARTMLHDRLQRPGLRLAGVAVVLHAAVEAGSGRVAAAPGFRGVDVDVIDRLAVPDPIPVHLDNVASAWASAEAMRGRLREPSSGLLIHSAVGVGGALVTSGRPARGVHDLAGEYGHLPFGTQDLVCRCGRRGCWETEVDQLALCARADVAISSSHSRQASSSVFTRAQEGDPVALGAVSQCATALGRGLGFLVTVHDPEVIVVAGHAAHLVAAAPHDVHHALGRSSFALREADLPPVRTTDLDDTAPLVGASDALFSHLMDAPLELLA